MVGQQHQRRAVCSLPRGRSGAAASAKRAGRGRAVIVYNLRGVTHFIPYQTSRVLPADSAARTHALRSRSHDRAYRASSELHARTRTHAFLYLSSLLCCHRITHRYGCPCQSNLNTLQKNESHLSQIQPRSPHNWLACRCFVQRHAAPTERLQ